MQKLFLSISLLFSGAFSFAINDSFLNDKSIPIQCVGHYHIELAKKNTETCTIVTLADGHSYFKCPPIDFELLKTMFEQYHSAKLNSDNTVENEKTNTTEQTENSNKVKSETAE